MVVLNLERLRTTIAVADDKAVTGSHEHQDKSYSLVEEEFAYTTAMFYKNMSNFSAWHQRSKLIPRLLDERKAGDEDRRKFFDAGVYT